MIDKIDGLGSIRAAQPVKRAAKSDSTGAPGFSRLVGDSEESSATGSLASANPVGSILGIQEVEDALDHASRGKMRAEDILDRLDDLRLELLSGGISREKMLQLSRLVAVQRGKIKDPRLAAILDEIDLRAQVELAKHAPS